jgi:hypothetical protein
MPQRGRDAVGGKHLTFRQFGHCLFHWCRSRPALDSRDLK